LGGLVPKQSGNSGNKTYSCFIDAPREKDFAVHFHHHVSAALLLVGRVLHVHFPRSADRVGMIKASFALSTGFDCDLALYEAI